jgi:hypothetical protein
MRFLSDTNRPEIIYIGMANSQYGLDAAYGSLT